MLPMNPREGAYTARTENWGTRVLREIHRVSEKHRPTPHGGGEAGTVHLCLGTGGNRLDSKFNI
jgi:hypothetical protein